MPHHHTHSHPPIAPGHGQTRQDLLSKQVIELPDGKLYQRRPGGNFHLQLTIRGQLLRKTTGTADITKAIKQVDRYRQHGLPQNINETMPTLDDLQRLITEEEQAGRLNPKTTWTYIDKLNLLNEFCQEMGIEKLPLMNIGEDLIRQYLQWRVNRPTLRNGRKPSSGKENRRVSARTLNNDLDHLRACFRRAFQRGWMDQEPTKNVARDRKAAHPKPRPLGRAGRGQETDSPATACRCMQSCLGMRPHALP